MIKLEGAIPALITPFTPDNQIDSEGFRRNIEFTVNGGVSAVVPCGTTGESATLSEKEHKHLVDLAVEYSKVPVIAGTGSNNTVESIEYTCHAADSGADAALVITPYYNKPSQNGLKAHFEKIADKSSIPIILYNVPSRTGVDLSVKTIADLAQHPNIIGIKEATGNVGKAADILYATADEEFTLLSGEDIATLPLLAIGATGAISVVADIVPDKMSQMISSFRKGDTETACRIHYELVPIMRSLFIETNPGPIKTACRLAGLAAGGLRSPLAELEPKNLEVLVNDLKALGVLK
ncbi:4-hydroxy-tetrahydrodipicolinate synthase [Methanosarcinaceae archaeon]|nr:4-hydroxy-tetrahydrodipicolinate synthase [Methanosarcinaceae archaeon]